MKMLKPLLPLFLLLFAGCAQEAATPMGELFITTQPSQATVLVNGEVIGLTPLSERVPAGRHVVSLRRDGFQVERFSAEVSPGDRFVRDVTLRPQQGLVLITSEPEGAAVSIGGVFQGNTPVALHNLRLGDHRARLVLLGFNEQEVGFTVEGRIPQQVNVELSSNSGTLVINSAPLQGATVFLDGRNVGETPVSLDRVPQGERDLVIQLPGHAAYRRSVLVSPNDTVRVDARLTAMPARLEVSSLPRGARIYLNEALRGEAPLVLEDLEPGNYVVRAELRGHADQSRTLTLPRGGSESVEFRMERNSGTLEIITRPADVRVIVNGEYVGTTRARGTDVISQPLQVEMLSQGFHTLQLVREGFAFETRRFSITRDEVTTLDETLRRIFIPNTIVRTGVGQDQAIIGHLVRTHPNGNVELEIREGIFRTIPAADIISVEPLRQERIEDGERRQR